jgi:hypothetical protein
MRIPTPMRGGPYEDPRSPVNRRVDPRRNLAHAWCVRRLVSLVLVAALAVVTLEVGLRLHLSADDRAALPRVGLVVDARDPTLVRFDDVLGWAPIRNLSAEEQAGEIHTTDDGRRGRSVVPRKRQPGRARVAIFGCERTFDVGVPDGDTYGARLARSLRDTDVLDFAVPGYGTDQMLLRWERDGAGYHPDVVVVGVGARQVRRNVATAGKPWFEWGDGGGLVLMGVPVTDQAPPATAHPVLDRSVLLRVGWRAALDRRAAGYDDAAWTLTRAILKRFAFEVHEHGARIVLLALDDDGSNLAPRLAQAAREDGGWFVAAGELPPGGARHEALARRLATTICAERLLPEAACATSGPGTASRTAS